MSQCAPADLGRSHVHFTAARGRTNRAEPSTCAIAGTKVLDALSRSRLQSAARRSAMLLLRRYSRHDVASPRINAQPKPSCDAYPGGTELRVRHRDEGCGRQKESRRHH
jgi:hypothetical protein